MDAIEILVLTEFVRFEDRRVLAKFAAEGWDENKHPRDDDGKFQPKGGGPDSGEGSPDEPQKSEPARPTVAAAAKPSTKPAATLKDWRKQQTPDEAAAVRAYQAFEGTAYATVRDYMLGKTDNAEAKQLAEDFASALSKAPVYSGNVYRGVRVDSAMVDKLAGAEVVELRSFGSSSADPAVAAKFAVAGQGKGSEGSMPVILKISAKTGAQVSPIGKLAAAGSEQEVILRPGTRYRVVKASKAEPKPGFRQATFELEELGPDEADDDVVTFARLVEDYGQPAPVSGERFTDDDDLWEVIEGEG
jgi:hypothetical protein